MGHNKAEKIAGAVRGPTEDFEDLKILTCHPSSSMLQSPQLSKCFHNSRTCSVRSTAEKTGTAELHVS